MDRINTLLTAVRNAIASTERERYDKISALLTNKVIRNGIDQRKTRQHQTAERFNIFDALWLDRREIYHSRFIAYLLDPSASHDQGTIFIDSFLKLFMPGWNGDAKHLSTRVVPEHVVDEYGRIDIVIYLQGAVIAIENKVDYGEGEKQLERYRQWLDKQTGANYKHLVFLTLDGRFPTDGKDKADIFLSYAHIAEWIDTAMVRIPKTAAPLLETLNQYRQLCLRIAHPGDHDMTQFNKDTLEIIRQPENLATALSAIIVTKARQL